ncbi:MBL fold metallo-hydrolase [Mycobacterium sp. OTB74]|uniref:MBL fold metallo-hydrolase n=1 Tax=Mycobacterium sp. OTB74 TaxID=1853452 RepID=UPI002474AB93|nr:MBL fold metallo-hydrolase [Mycobacterium sp. OTB74]MDH6244074.1 glyoxylase-like metal-dependent hydrolase (beta-lactamase superfamily II) [Mycobacterium sp. OTB74]
MSLQHSTFVTAPLPQAGRGPLPDGSTRMWSPITSTLITNDHDAVLVDPPLTSAQADQVGDWVAASGLRLRHIYITHGHGDHWFGAIPLLRRFPGATALATAGTQRLMAKQNSPEFRKAFWDKFFPGQLPSGDVSVDVIDHTGFELDGIPLLPIEAGHTDTDATTMLHVPDSGLVVAGDVVYNGVHQYLAESGGTAGIDSWLAALDTLEALNPTTVIAGHKSPEAPDDFSQIAATRTYLTDARTLVGSSATAQEFYAAMLALHPHRLNPGALWGSAVTLLPRE